MKRIKCEEIQNTIQNYVKQRNLCNNNYLTKYSVTNTAEGPVLSTTVSGEATPVSNTTVDFSLMALNDLALIESSISDFCAFSFDSLSESEYMKQFESLRKLVEKNDSDGDQLNQLLYPILVYAVIDLVTAGLDSRNMINKYMEDSAFQSKLNESQKSFLSSLLAFNQVKNIDSFPQIKEWTVNKYLIEIELTQWRIFLRLVTDAKAHLPIRILNLNLQVVFTGQSSDDTENHQLESNDQKNSLRSTISSMVKHEEMVFDNNYQAKAANRQFDNMIKKEPSASEATVNLSNLLDCIRNVSLNEPSRLNAACCFYLDDVNDCVTSSSISPNRELLSFPNENSSISLYKLYADADQKQPRFCQELVGGHTGPVFNSKFTHDSKYLISCGDDGQACLWNVHNPNSIPVSSRTESADSEHDSEDEEQNAQDFFDDKIVRASSGHKKRIEPERILPVCVYSGHSYPVWDVEPFSRLNLFATGSRDATARLWSFDRVYPLRNYCGHHSDVNSVRFHPNGSYLATGSSDKTVRMWSVETGEFVRLFSSHRSRVFAVAFSPDGNYIASSGEDRKVKVWDIRAGGLCKEFKGHTDTVHALHFDQNSDVLCSGGLDRTVKFWNVHSRNIVIEPEFSLNGQPGVKTGVQQSTTAHHPGCSSELMRSVALGFNVYSISVDVQNVFYFLGARKPSSTSLPKVDQASLFAKKESVNLDRPSSQNLKTTPPPPQHQQQQSISSEEAAYNTRRRSAATYAQPSQPQTSSQQQQSLPPNSTNYLLNDDDLYEV